VVIPLPVVAAAFFLTGVACLIDMHLIGLRSRKLFRLFQAAAFFMGAVVYAQAVNSQADIPQPEIRIVIVAICILGISEILSRWNIWGIAKIHRGDKKE